MKELVNILIAFKVSLVVLVILLVISIYSLGNLTAKSNIQCTDTSTEKVCIYKYSK